MSKEETIKHIENVREKLEVVINCLRDRGNVHDDSKLEAPEEPIFSATTPKLKNSTYGSEEYKSLLKELGPALEHHYESNDHHPEYHDQWRCIMCKSFFSRWDERLKFDQYMDNPDLKWCPSCHPNGYPGFFETALIKMPGIYNMNLLQLIEMLADWKAAGERHANGSMAESLKINKERFKINDPLFTMLESTCEELGWI